MLLVTAGQMQDMDQQTISAFGIPGRVLMENAGRGAFDFFMDTFNPADHQTVAVLAGSGNNGGDGFVIARYLIEKKIQTTVFLLTSKTKVANDAKTNMTLFETLCDKSDYGSIIELPDAQSFINHKTQILLHDFFVDAILGTGLHSEVKGFIKDAIEVMNTAKGPVFAVDIPSGLHSDTGHPLGIAVKADATATFGFAKIGHILYPGNFHTGKLKIIDIGIPQFIAHEQQITLSLMEKHQVAALFKPRTFISHKGSFGHLLVLAGSPGKTGSAAFCANAAMRSGTGLVTLGIARSLNKLMEPLVLEPMTHPLPEKKKGILSDECFDQIQALAGNKQALALGPGIGTGRGTQRLVFKLIASMTIPMVIDADGLNCLADNLSILKEKKAPVILTPHPGEMARLCKTNTTDIQADRIHIASRFAQDHDVIVVLKGAQTIISFPDRQSFICPTGNPGMAAGGMGDVLTGLIAGFCAQGFTPENASLAGVYIHGLCADVLAGQTGGFGFLASDMITNIPNTIFHHLL
ncbi:MAG: NAD(P)H-hydrate dehydratase [Pseudomonadota bacterium]